MAQKLITLEKDEKVSEAIKRVDSGPLPIINFETVKCPNFSVIGYDENDDPIYDQDISKSIRRADDPSVKLGVSSGSVGGEYTLIPNMEVVEAFFPVHEEQPGQIVIWNSEKGKRCGIEAISETHSINGNEWISRTTVTNSFDLTRCLETSCVLVRSSDGLRYPVTLPGGTQRVRHTSGSKLRYKTVAKYREKVRDVLEEQINMMYQFSNYEMDWNTFKDVLLKAVPSFDPDKAPAEKGATGRRNKLAKIGSMCYGGKFVMDHLIGFMRYLSESPSRVCEGKDPAEVKFLSITDGDKFGKLKAVQSACFSKMCGE